MTLDDPQSPKKWPLNYPYQRLKKCTQNAGQTACCYMFVEGNPAPTFKFFKGTQEIIEGGRYKLISDGDNNNMIMMAISKVKSTDESEYRVYIENEHGSDEANFMLFVSGYKSFHFFLSLLLEML